MTASTTWREIAPADEDARFERYAKQLVALQVRNAERGAIGRALHHKSHGVYEATLEIDADVPAHARHGLFAKPARYEALVRYSNGSGKVAADRVGDVRGLAVKVLGVDGTKVLGDAATQDFLAIVSPATPFRTADEFVAVVWAMRSKPLALFRLIGALGPRRAISLVRTLVASLSAPPVSLASKRFYSALPIQCGPHAVRFAFTPVEPAPAAAEPLSAGADFFREALVARLQRAPIRYALSLQFFVDEARTPIEDSSIDWDEAVSPHVAVGKLVVAQQDATSARGQRLAERAEALAFDPWHALVAHRPLGGMMRARKHAYFASGQARGVAPEPTTIAALLDA